jgi:hypothetical protein
VIEVHYGTPNELGLGARKDTQSAAVKWARDYLQGMEKQADKYDRAALEHIRATREQMLQTSPISKGDKRRWSFDYISIRFVIEIRNPA